MKRWIYFSFLAVTIAPFLLLALIAYIIPPVETVCQAVCDFDEAICRWAYPGQPARANPD